LFMDGGWGASRSRSHGGQIPSNKYLSCRKWPRTDRYPRASTCPAKCGRWRTESLEQVLVLPNMATGGQNPWDKYLSSVFCPERGRHPHGWGTHGWGRSLTFYYLSSVTTGNSEIRRLQFHQIRRNGEAPDLSCLSTIVDLRKISFVLMLLLFTNPVPAGL